MSTKYAKLFEPASIGGVSLKNRLAMAPMGMVGMSDYMGGFTENAQNYYIERAKGGVGPIITGICCVDYSGVDIQTGKTADADYIRKLDPDCILAATGALPITLDLGNENTICTAEDILLDAVTPSENIVVIGGGLVGCETALWLAQKGKKVAVVELADDILGGPHGMPVPNSSMLRELMAFHGVDIYTSAKAEKVSADTVLIGTENGTVSIEADTVIVSVGYKSDNGLYGQVRQIDIPAYNIGDSRKVQNVMHAIWDAYEVDRGI